MTDNSRQALVGAFGGTYISLATVDIDQLTVANFALLDSAAFSSPMEAIERDLPSVPRCPRMVSLSIAGQLDRDGATMDHLRWKRFDRNDIRAVTDADKVCFVNEFDALALAMPHMTKYELIPLGDGIVAPGGPKAVVAAGTGVGTAGLFLVDGRWQAQSGRSALASLPTRTSDFDFSDFADESGLVQANRVLTGNGLVAVYKKLGGTRTAATPRAITSSGLDGTDEVATWALDVVARCLGRFAGDMALHFGATGGVYLAGGLPTGTVDVLKKEAFRKAFEGVGERQEHLRDVAVFGLKAAADPGLRGAAAALADSLPRSQRSGRRT